MFFGSGNHPSKRLRASPGFLSARSRRARPRRRQNRSVPAGGAFEALLAAAVCPCRHRRRAGCAAMACPGFFSRSSIALRAASHLRWRMFAAISASRPGCRRRRRSFLQLLEATLRSPVECASARGSCLFESFGSARSLTAPPSCCRSACRLRRQARGHRGCSRLRPAAADRSRRLRCWRLQVGIDQDHPGETFLRLLPFSTLVSAWA